jgi:hypothetical protein
MSRRQTTIFQPETKDWIMPLGPGVRYRVKTFASGKKVRLAFKGKGKVVETKSLQTGEIRHPQKAKKK